MIVCSELPRGLFYLKACAVLGMKTKLSFTGVTIEAVGLEMTDTRVMQVHGKV
jgi:hypothetical protein